jgi:pSer/pThr/pTyr-binding forkhead associated (FHA) protein
MISPELIVFGSGRDKVDPTSQRFLVMLEPGNHTKCLLDQDLLTIGRSESADIQIDGDFISRIHVRLLRIGMDTVVEDAGSKNGTWVNGERIKRQVLKHGDLIRVGSVNFRLVDSGAADGEPI